MDGNDEKGGGLRFWLTVLGLLVAAIIAGVIVFIVIGWAWYAWGFLAVMLLVGAALIGFGYVYDRREQNRRRRLAG